jgi:2-hydroxychromene-2-carboxylate isomerase
MASSVAELGVDVDGFLARVDADELQELFIQNTQQALDEGIFGAPTMRIENEIYWGKDRFEFIEDHLAGA